MTGCVIISRKKSAVLDKTIEMLHSNFINNKQLASTAICSAHVPETDLRQELCEFVFIKDIVLEN